MRSARQHRMHGERVVVTRPSAAAGALVAQLQRLGAVPLRLPGTAWRPVVDTHGVTAALHAALADQVLVFSSPAAVRFAARRLALTTEARIITPGHATARALARVGVQRVDVPERHDSEGVLQHPLLRHPRDCRIALIGAAGGRGLLADTLRARGARVREVHVYRRVPPRITRRHVAAVRDLQPPFHVLLSSVGTIMRLQQALPPDAWSRLCRGIAICSSTRVADAARNAGFTQWRTADSAHSADLVRAVVATVHEVTPGRNSS